MCTRIRTFVLENSLLVGQNQTKTKKATLNLPLSFSLTFAGRSHTSLALVALVFELSSGDAFSPSTLPLFPPRHGERSSDVRVPSLSIEFFLNDR